MSYVSLSIWVPKLIFLIFCFFTFSIFLFCFFVPRSDQIWNSSFQLLRSLSNLVFRIYASIYWRINSGINDPKTIIRYSTFDLGSNSANREFRIIVSSYLRFLIEYHCQYSDQGSTDRRDGWLTRYLDPWFWISDSE